MFTNLLFMVLSIIFYFSIARSSQPYARQMALFILFLGISSGFGAVSHGAHYAFGDLFFNVSFFLVNAFSLLSIFYCFKGPYIYSTPQPSKKVINAVKVWIAVLMVFCLLKNEFVIIKIHAGLVLIYSLIAHYRVYRKTRERGSRIIVTGILISFLSIIVHTARFSFGEWFNYKDIAHVIMVITLIMIYRGVMLNVQRLDAVSV